MGVCPECGVRVEFSDAAHDRCANGCCSWSQVGNATAWSGTPPGPRQRLVPIEWINAEQSRGLRRGLFAGRMALWRTAKLITFPLRWLLKVRMASFQERSRTDRILAEKWRDHYFKNLDIPTAAVMYEYSYRKAEKAGFAKLLGYRVVVQDIREHDWWNDDPDVWFTVVPDGARHIPLLNSAVDLVFLNGVIFDMNSERLQAFVRECLRILKPGGYLVIWGGNSMSRARARSEKRWHGRIHSLERVRSVSRRAGFGELDCTFEGFSPHVFVSFLDTLRRALSPWSFKTYDFDSLLGRWQSPEKRAYWLLRLVKPTRSAH